MFLLYLVAASMMLAHLGWAGELIPTYHGRTNVLGAVQVASMIGQVLMLVDRRLCRADACRRRRGRGRCGGGFGHGLDVGAPVAGDHALAVALVPEAQRPPQPHMSLMDTVRTLVQNRSALRVLLPDFLLGIAQGVSGGLFLFYFQFVLGFERESQTLLAIYFVAGLAGVPIWWFAARRWGKHRALQGAFVYTAATHCAAVRAAAGRILDRRAVHGGRGPRARRRRPADALADGGCHR